ncbi:MAG: dihydrofolate reductase [Haliscomenobacter sp.]|nr:dihydrofolate reductase [Haliscomenobacter sp.]
MIVSAIVAMSQNGVIGKDNQIPWYLPADLKYFKRTTLHHHVIMGRHTFASIGRPLPLRTNIVVTRAPFFIAAGILVAHSVEEALSIALDSGETEAFIIGGGQIYRQSLPYWDKVYLTRVETTVEGDTFFPELDSLAWKKISSEPHLADERNEFPYQFEVHERLPSSEPV